MVAGSRLVVIDFQGARLGPPQYDLASLLWDPYAKLSDELRERLVAWYLEESARGSIPGVPGAAAVSRDPWHQQLLANAANRLMQALGAYAKLGGRLGRPGFWEHIPWALSALAEVLDECGDSPALIDLLGELQVSDWGGRS